MTTTENLEEDNDIPRGKPDSLREWRREKVWELKSCGMTIEEIVETLKTKPNMRISHGTVSNDLRAKQDEIEKNFSEYIRKDLPMQHHLAVTGLDRVIKEAWRIYLKAGDDRTRLQALATVSNATMQKQSVLGDPAQIERAMRAVAKMKQELAT